MKTNGIQVAYVAGLARLKLTPDEENLFQTQLGNILDYVAQLNAVDTSSVPDHPIDPHLPVNVLRLDEERPSLSREASLQNAPKQADHLLIMPKIVE
ncbi:MAG: Asp-tRNA(Asn)/Glu-tRNA(Gln) amidotransferase subunit GatC [Candidatus Methylacidiphilales bacterium]|nr:Asp-tRNA(Asn)/Glu-tRNA(Gln) amidotransferase subunit GatC [Candidatus Methylacidiphilales bacterium]